jgi:hypothetical protein
VTATYAAIHPNEGDIDKQRALDEAVLLQLRELFVELLDDIYEQPETRAARLAALRAARDVFQALLNGGMLAGALLSVAAVPRSPLSGFILRQRQHGTGGCTVRLKTALRPARQRA